MPAGRPTKYKPEYCQQLIDHMSQGLSFESFAANLNTWAGTLYRWEQEFSEFREAKNIGFERCRAFYEKAGVAGMMGKVKNFNQTVWLFNLKNRFPKQWRDRHEIDVHATIETKESGPERLVEEIKMVLNKPNESGPPQFVPVSDRDVSQGPQGLLQEQPVLDSAEVFRIPRHQR